ncbi:unnamed protein product, partial [Durusdinium trenchii]
AAMDMKYLTTRCEEGRKQVTSLQARAHCYKGLPSLADAHAELLQFMTAHGGT